MKRANDGAPPPKQRHLYAVKIVQTAEVLVCAEDEETARAIVAAADMSHEFSTDSPPGVVSMSEVRRGDIDAYPERAGERARRKAERYLAILLERAAKAGYDIS